MSGVCAYNCVGKPGMSELLGGVSSTSREIVHVLPRRRETQYQWCDLSLLTVRLTVRPPYS